MNSRQRYLRVVRVFLAGPSDVFLLYLEYIRQALIILNEPGGFAERNGIFFQVLDGTKNTVPQRGDPESVILDQIPPQSWDIFICTFWNRFGSPTRSTNPWTGRPFASGTYEEFYNAYLLNKKMGRPRILLYRCERRTSGPVDPEQRALLDEFWFNCSSLGLHPIFYKCYKHVEALQGHIFHDLIQLVHSLSDSLCGLHLPLRATCAKEEGEANSGLVRRVGAGVSIGNPQVEQLRGELASKKKSIVDFINKSGPVIAASAVIDRVYEILDYFAADIFRRSTRGDCSHQELLHELLAVDEEIANAALAHPTSLLGMPGGNVCRLVDFVAGRRSWVIANLKSLGPLEIESLASFSATSEQLCAGQSGHLSFEDAFAGLMLHHGEELYSRIVQRQIEPQLASALWAKADALLIENLQVRQPIGEKNRSFFGALSESPDSFEGFRIVRALLGVDAASDVLAIEKMISNDRSVALSAKSMEVIWRCLLVGHSNSGVRKEALGRLADARHLWLTLIHPQIPLCVIQEALLRFHKEADQDRQRLLFDCVRSRMLRAVWQQEEDFKILEDLLLTFLSLEALKEEGYWIRLETLCTSFAAQASLLGFKCGAVERSRSLNSAGRKKYRALSKKAPDLIGRLLPAVQRQLAREGSYICFFSELDPGISLELLPHIIDLKSVLNHSTNGMLFRSISEKERFSVANNNLKIILHHPKCSPRIAEPKLSRLSKMELMDLKNDRGANLAVRAVATRQLLRLGVKS
jgi:hypothetical protein